MNQINRNSKITIRTEVKKLCDSKIKLLEQEFALNFSSIKLGKTSHEDQRYPDTENVQLSDINRAHDVVFQAALGEVEGGYDKRQVFETFYAFPDESNIQNYPDIRENIDLLNMDTELIPVNLSPGHAVEFLNFLINRAHTVKKIEDKEEACKLSRFFLIGDLGSGKTTFINYLYSMYAPNLKAKRIFWVNLDLTKGHHNKENLCSSLSFQIAKIFREHYFNNLSKDEYKDLTNLIKNEFIEPGNSDRGVEEPFFNEVKYNDAFRKYNRPFNKSQEQPYDSKLQAGIRKYIEKKYDTIYIFDGLDDIDSNVNFKKTLDQVKNVLWNENLVGVYLFVMRHDSHSDLRDHRGKGHEIKELTYFKGYGKTLTLFPADFDKIVEGRIRFISKYWEDFLRQRKYIVIPDTITQTQYDEQKLQELINKYKKWINPISLEAYHDIFMRFVHKGVSFEENEKLSEQKWTITESYSVLESIIGTNVRRLIDALKLLHHCFLETVESARLDPQDITNIYNSLEYDDNKTKASNDLWKILAKDYRVIPILLRGSKGYRHPFNYKKDLNGSIYRDKDGEGNSRIDTYPLIYSVLYPINICNQNLQNYHLLLKCRILQFMQINKDKKVHREDILVYLSENFPYKPEYINMAIKELFDTRHITNRPDGQSVQPSFYLRISEIGENQIMNLVEDFNYLRIILDDLLVPQDLVHYFTDPCPERFKDDSKTAWLINQIPRVAKLILLIRKVENFEKKSYKKDDFADNWAITGRIYKGFSDTITNIIHNRDNDLQIVKDAFKNN